MAQEDKELLLKDLCARLFYGVKVSLQTGERKLTGVLDAVYPTDDRVIVDDLSEAIAPINVRTGGFLIERNNVKPFLRPMSSMTEDERKYIEDKCAFTTIGPIGGNFGLVMPVIAAEWLTDFYNSHYLDWRGLIEKGLALEAPDGMYKV